MMMSPIVIEFVLSQEKSHHNAVRLMILQIYELVHPCSGATAEQIRSVFGDN